MTTRTDPEFRALIDAVIDILRDEGFLDEEAKPTCPPMRPEVRLADHPAVPSRSADQRKANL